MKKRMGYALILAFLALYIVLTYVFKIENCLVQLIWGIPCPGCGMTRAFFACLRLDFKEAFKLNPMIFLLPIIAIIILFRKKGIFQKIYKSNILWLSLIFLVIASYVVRMCYYFPNEPLSYYPNNLFRKIIKLLIVLLRW